MSGKIPYNGADERSQKKEEVLNSIGMYFLCMFTSYSETTQPIHVIFLLIKREYTRIGLI